MAKNKDLAITLLSLYNFNHLGIRSIHSYLQSKGFSPSIVFFKDMLYNDVDEPTQQEYSLLVDHITRQNPSVVGISVNCSTFFNVAKRISEEIKKQSNALILWGGVHATIAPESCIEHADMVCVGEGEEAFLELVEKMQGNIDISNIPNFWMKKEGEIIRNSPRDYIADLNTLTLPDYSSEKKFFIKKNKLHEGDPFYDNDDLYSILTGRGCPFKCTYCINHLYRNLYKGKGSYLRRRSVEHVIRELKAAKKTFPSLKRVMIFDDVFVFDKKWAEQFCIEYKKEIHLTFTCLFHPKTIQEDIVSLLVDAGLDYINIGVESGSERVRRDIFDRTDTNDDIRKAAAIMHRFKINPIFDLILDNPFENTVDKEKTLELLLSMPRPFQTYLYSMTFFPKTKMTERALGEGLIKPDDIEDKKCKVYDQYYATFSYKDRSSEDMFWLCLYSLAGKKFIPKKIILLMSSFHFLKRKPSFLIALAMLSNYIRMAGIFFARVKSGEMTIAAIKKYYKLALTVSR